MSPLTSSFLQIDLHFNFFLNIFTISRYSFTPPYGPQLSRAVAFSPNNTVFAEFMYDAFVNEVFHNETQFYDNLTVIAVDTAEDLEQLLKMNRTIIAGIQFNHENVSKEVCK